MQREQDGWMEEEEEALSDSYTHTLPSLPWCPSSLSVPSSFWISEPALAASHTVEWGFSVGALPPPHAHIHTQMYTLSLKFSHSLTLHVTAYHS